MAHDQTLGRQLGETRLWLAETAAELPQAQEWDRFVATTAGGDLIQTSAWAAAKRALGFETAHVELRRGSGILGGAQMVIRRFGRLGALGYVARGPVVADAAAEEVAALLAKLEAAAGARRVRHLIVQPPEGGEAVVAALTTRGYMMGAPAVAPTATLRIDLARSLDEILAAMSASRRTQIRRSQRAGVEIRLGDRNSLDLFHQLHQATARRQGFAALSDTYLRSQWDALAAMGAAQLIFAWHEGRPLAAIWVTAFGESVTYRIPGWSGEGERLQPNAACHWGAIQWAKAQGYRYYDLGGLERGHAELLAAGRPVPEAMQQSHGNFKTRFGAELVLLPLARQWTFNPLARAVVRAAWPRLARSTAFDRLLTRMRSG